MLFFDYHEERGVMEEKANPHEFIQGATDEDLEKLELNHGLDPHLRQCSSCNAKWEQAIDRRLSKMPPEKRAILEQVARELADKFKNNSRS